ncbi:hypothetical protein [Nocardia sp. alder85J]|uniref:hypothetical protein n=1 Tax=Nocardia sp. alder85J TaxID=2862949 RepID=UPI001CD6F9F3|nr:hypothetical protein [Nocardia sp. alder85J]MCX4094758.1 hypothetical protein [Nocardia sp. alder85J]
MTIDLTGGIDPERENVFADRPDDPEMRDSVSMWIFDDRGAVALPRFGIEAVAAQWHHRDHQLNLTLADGRAYRLREPGKAHSPLDEHGRPSVLGAGPLEFRCVTPFRTWTATFRGAAVETSTAALTRAEVDGPRADLEFEIETTMAVPPWIQGSLLPEAKALLDGSVEGDLMGGPRYEQLFRATGVVRVRGEEHAFTGSGLRIRRQGVRQLSEFWGHAWQSAVFPSGKAFGYIAYPPRADGRPTFNEGYLFTGDGELIPARVVEAPWLARVVPTGEDVSLVLESERLGRVRITGETLLATHDLTDRGNFPALQQTAVRYTWDGEQTYGMLERSSMRDKVEGLPARAAQ